MRWTHTPPPADEVEALCKGAGVSRVLAELLLRAGQRDPATAGAFLQPSLATINDPFLLKNLQAGAARLRQAIAKNEQVVVLGDYDVDGVSSTALLVMILRRFGLHPAVCGPATLGGWLRALTQCDRPSVGGRIARPVYRTRLRHEFPRRGRLPRVQGIDVMVIDHHRSRERVLTDGILINPHVDADETNADAAWRHLCTVGLVFKLCHGLLKQLRIENHPTAFEIKLRDHLDLVALGTVADLVPLLGENRVMARHGLRILQDTQRPGLQALMDVAGA
jgi:single-stranded-DNA-specific exonuclease